MSLLPKVSTKVPAPTKVGTQATAAKIPKSKKMADPFGKPSLFFKSEEGKIKRESIQKLHDFLMSHRVKAETKAKPAS